MEKIKVNEDILGFVFKRLRMQEGIELGKASSSMNSETIFKILINAKFKQERGITLTELEKTISKESGAYIRTYVAQKWDEAKSENVFTEIPYERLSKTSISDLVKAGKAPLDFGDDKTA